MLYPVNPSNIAGMPQPRLFSVSAWPSRFHRLSVRVFINWFPCCSHASEDHPNSFLSNQFNMSFFNCIFWFGLICGKRGGRFLLFLCVAIINVKRLVLTVSECCLEDSLLSFGIASSVMRNSMYCPKHGTISDRRSLGFDETFS